MKVKREFNLETIEPSLLASKLQPNNDSMIVITLNSLTE